MLSYDRVVTLFRLSLGITFLWFGMLKMFNVSPILNIIKVALPPFLGESQFFLFILSLVEVLIGIAFLANRYVKIASIVMIIHLAIASLAVLFTQGFDPRFPLLSLAGEFVVKNLVLMTAGLFLVIEKTQPNGGKEVSRKEEKAHQLPKE
jgi:uncharacterized membrane protein YkgB